MDHAKLGMWLAILTLLIGFWQWDRNSAHQAGYDKRVAEEKEAGDTTLKATTTRMEKETTEAKAEAEKWRKKALEEQEKKPPYREVKVYVDRVVEVVKDNPNCSNLVGVRELWNGIRSKYP